MLYYNTIQIETQRQTHSPNLSSRPPAIASTYR
uniref:Uncharacterized protein n=1 Tax=Escherichia phage Baskent_phicoli_1 TaxID=3145031 RepID=A0AAU8BAM2_9CAUD